MRTFLFLAISLFTCLLASGASAQTALPNRFGEARGSYVPKVDVTDRRQMINLYNTYNVRWKSMLSHSETFPTGRTSDVSKCFAGDIAPAFRELIVRQANVYRAIAGLNSAKVADKTFNDAAQAGALIQQQYWATDTRSPSHFPKLTDACFTTIGANVSAISNLQMGIFSGAISPQGYIDDGGSYNEVVGHRWTFLTRNVDKFAVGDVRGVMPALQNGTYSGNVMTPFTRTLQTGDSEPVFWPPRDAILPVEWYPISSNRWSIQCQACSYGDAVVSMKFQGRPIAVSTVVSGGRLIWTIEDAAATYDTKNYASVVLHSVCYLNEHLRG
jgi:hypothetical protein